jgi:5'-nucleotidase / UDP-sugar diphosphatase
MMMLRIPTVMLAVMLLAVAFPAFGQGVEPAHGSFSLTILHVNDTHSNFLANMLSVSFPPDSTIWRIPVGSVARMATVVDSIRGDREDVLFLHAGDMVQGTLFYTLFGGEADAAVYNAMGLDAMCPGNHEFDRGSEGLAVLLEDAEFPVVCANLDVTGDSLLAGRIAPYTILDVGGENVAVIGVVVDELVNVSSPSAATVVLPVLETVQGVIDLLEEQGVNRIIILSHIGYEGDLALAAGLSGADIIVGGHSHTVLGDLAGIGVGSEGSYPAVAEGADGAEVLVVTAGTRTAMLGVLTVGFDAEGHVESFEGAPVFVTGGGYQDASRNPVTGDDLVRLEEHLDGSPLIAVAEEDPAITQLVGVYEAELAAFAYEVVGNASEDLLHQRVPGGDLPGGSLIAPVICDAMLWKAEQVGLEPDIAILNAGGARIPVPEGEITVGTVYTLLPFGNTLAVLDISGAQVKAVLEDAISNIFDEGNSDGSFPYAAGLRYSASAGMPEGERVESIEILDDDGGWSPVDPVRTYRVVTPFFLARGGDGYASFAGVEALDTGFMDAEVFMDYLIETGTVSPGESRVSFAAD